MMSVVASNLSTVGMRKSDLGLFELMWYPLATRKESGTVTGLPCLTVMTGAGAIFTAGPCGARSSCAQDGAENRRSALARRIFIGYPQRLKAACVSGSNGMAEAMPLQSCRGPNLIRVPPEYSRLRAVRSYFRACTAWPWLRAFLMWSTKTLR